MLSDAANPATRSPAVSGVLGDTLAALSKFFEITRPAASDRVAPLWWLAALLIAGGLVRFWALGAVSLHGDEETMALAVRHILIDGRPILPSGMFYPRGMTQLYLMALSVAAFGESEWALRLPSAMCGVLLIGVAWLAGRRFLRPHWNLAFAASIAFLPSLILDSQTARMYIFLVTAVTAAMVCVFEWERTERVEWLIGAVAVLIVGIDMHVLAVGSVLMFLVPGAIHGDVRKLIHGAIAAAAVGVGYLAIDGWVNAQYPVPPAEFAASFGPAPWERSHAPQPFALMFAIAAWAAGLVVAFLAVHAARAIPGRTPAVASVVLLIAGVALQLAFYYHLAAIFYLAGAVMARRSGSSLINPRLLYFAIGCSVLAVIHITALASNAGSIMRLAGSLVGQPSVWPYVRIAQLSELAGVLTAALLAVGAYQLALARRTPDYWLLAVLGVWAPVFALGLFAWNVPSRYTEMALAPMLLCAFAAAQRAVDWLLRRLKRSEPRNAIIAALTAACVINPVHAAAVINAGYALHPDHKGAAEFIQAQQISDQDLVLAEDVLQQTYYLGAVDYWLIGGNIARRFVKRAGEGVVDFYTGTPVIATGAMLDDLLQKNADRRIFVIGSGEQQSDKRRGARGPELDAALQSDRFEVVHTGRDGLTRVLRAVSGAIAPSRSTSVQAGRDANALAAEADASAEAASDEHGTRAPARAE